MMDHGGVFIGRNGSQWCRGCDAAAARWSDNHEGQQSDHLEVDATEFAAWTAVGVMIACELLPDDSTFDAEFANPHGPVA